MDYSFAEKLDTEWNSIFQKHLKHFSYQNKSETYSIDDLLKEIFCPDPIAEHDVKYEDKEVFEKCLIESLQLLSNRATLPRQSQIRYLLNIAKYICKDESCFINLTLGNVLLSLIYVSQASMELSTKFQYLEFLHSFLNHPSGVKWLMETKYWTEVFALTVNYQNLDDRFSEIGHKSLRILLEKTIDGNEKYCEEIMRLIAEPLLNAAQQIKLMVPYSSAVPVGLKSNLMCLVEILEGLIKNYSADVLRYIMNLKVGLASEVLSENCNDVEECLLLDRITMILSFFGLTDIFDGISVKQDPLILSGFVTIINRRIDKGAFSAVYELYYYALKYIQPISDKLPKYYCKDKEKFIEDQIVPLQLEPLLLEWVRVDGDTVILEEPDAEIVSTSHPTNMFRNLCLKTLHIGFKIKDKLPPCSFDVYIKAVETITRSKDFYSKKNLCYILDSLVYSLEAPLKYLQSKKNEQVIIEHAHQLYILALLEATLVFLEYDLKWSDSVKVLDLLYIVIEGSSSYQWIEPIMLLTLMLLQEIIPRRFSPSMALLIDTPEGIQNIGPLLYKTCFTKEWKVRKAVLEVVHTITLCANHCFSTFKTILYDASLPSLISTMALNDENLYVRATALKCIQQMIVMKGFEKILPLNTLINKVLEIILKNIYPEVTKEAVKLISTIYNHEKHLAKDVKLKIYQCLEHVTVVNNKDANVQKEVVLFWQMVTTEYFVNEGWVNPSFPTVTFSKKIIPLTHEEVNKRYYKILNALSRIGTLNVFEKFWQFDGVHEDAKKSLTESIHGFHYTFLTDKITPESMLFNQEFLDLYSIRTDPLISSQGSDDILQEIIGDTMVKMMNVDLEFVNDKDPFAQINTRPLNTGVPSTAAGSRPDTTNRLTPSEFVELVNKKKAELSFNGHSLKESPFKETEVYVIDY